jgi:hypothetical protein
MKSEYMVFLGMILVMCIGIGTIYCYVLFDIDISFATNPSLEAKCYMRSASDEKITIERVGDGYERIYRYHVYEVCIARNRSVISNTSLGYLTLEQITVKRLKL